MADFTLDTSGAVNVPPRTDQGRTATWRCEWDQLDPFTQGYVRALFAAGDAAMPADRLTAYAGFRDISPETLAAILRECGAWRALYPNTGSGARFWELRNLQLVSRPDFPPLTPYLGDDGRVYLREASKATGADQ